MDVSLSTTKYGMENQVVGMLGENAASVTCTWPRQSSWHGSAHRIHSSSKFVAEDTGYGVCKRREVALLGSLEI